MLSLVDEITKESRQSHEKFHQHWSILAGGSLTVLIAFVKDFASSANYVAREAFFFALLFFILSLVLSPLRNFASTLLVGLMGDSVGKSKEEVQSIYRDGRFLAIFCNVCGLLSIGAYILGMIVVTYSLYLSYFSY